MLQEENDGNVTESWAALERGPTSKIYYIIITIVQSTLSTLNITKESKLYMILFNLHYTTTPLHTTPEGAKNTRMKNERMELKNKSLFYPERIQVLLDKETFSSYCRLNSIV